MILLFIPVHFDGVFTLFCFKIDSTKAIVRFVVRVLFLFLQSLFCTILLVAFNILLLLASFKKARRHIRVGESNLNQKEKCNRKQSQK